MRGIFTKKNRPPSWNSGRNTVPITKQTWQTVGPTYEQDGPTERPAERPKERATDGQDGPTDGLIFNYKIASLQKKVKNIHNNFLKIKGLIGCWLKSMAG